MTYKEANELMDAMHTAEQEISRTKGIEYSQGDRLDSFKRIAKELDITPKQVLWVYLKKHLDSIASYIKTGSVLSEPIEDRIKDARVYLFLLRALIAEENNEDSQS